MTYPVLRQPDVTRPFTVYTDASGYALGAILAQHDDNNQEYVCHYASRLLKNAEIHYGNSEKECLAIVYAIRQFRIYLHGFCFFNIYFNSVVKRQSLCTEVLTKEH